MGAGSFPTLQRWRTDPLRFRIESKPGLFYLSSYHANALGRHEARIQPHASFQTLGADDHARREAYRQLIDAGLSPPEAEALGEHTRQQKPWGSDRFRRQIEALTQRSTEVRPRGRPARSREK